MNSQLIYRGCAYQTQSVSTPVIKQEIERFGKYRGASISLKQYEFQTAKLNHLNWRTMRFLGKPYFAVPTLAFGTAQ